MKKNNPTTPILIREAAGTLPKIYARYGTTSPPKHPNRTPPLPSQVTTPVGGAERQVANSSLAVEFGNEKAQSLEGLTDKQIEETVTGLVKNGA